MRNSTNRPIFSTTCNCGISAVSATTSDCGACTTNTTGTSTTFQMYCNCEIFMVWAINLHSFLHCLDHRHLSLTTAGMSTTCHAGHEATVESRLSSPRPASGPGESRQNHDLHLWNLHDMHNQDVDHKLVAQGRSQPQSTCGTITTCTTGTSATLKSAATAEPSKRAFVVVHNGHVNDLSKNKYDACNCGISAVFTQTAHVESAGYLPNSDVDHLFNGLQLENLYVFLNSQDHRKLHLHHDGDVDDLVDELQLWRNRSFLHCHAKHVLLHTNGHATTFQ